MAVSESQARLTASETAKWIVVYKNGDQRYPGRRMVVKPREVKTFDHLLEEVTLKLSPSFGAVRNIFTPEGGTRISSLTDIQPNGHYVASPNEPFRQLSRTRYTDIPIQSSTQSHISLQPSGDKPPVGPRRVKAVPSRYRDAAGDDIIIHVFKNGDAYSSASAFRLNKVARTFWDQTLTRIGQKLQIGRGVQKLYTVRGQLIRDPSQELEHGGHYVAASDYETFRLVNYGAVVEPFKNVTRGDSRIQPSPEPCSHVRRPAPEPRSSETPRLPGAQRTSEGAAGPTRPVPAQRWTPLPPLRTSFSQLAERAQRLRENIAARSEPRLAPDALQRARKRLSLQYDPQFSSPVTTAYPLESTSPSDTAPESSSSSPDYYYGGVQNVVHPTPSGYTTQEPFYLHPVREERSLERRDAVTQFPIEAIREERCWDPGIRDAHVGPDSVDMFLDTVPTVQEAELEVTTSASEPWTSPLPAETVEYVSVTPPWYHDYRPPESSHSTPSIPDEADTPEFSQPRVARGRMVTSPISFRSDGYSPMPVRATTPVTPPLSKVETRKRFHPCVFGYYDSVYRPPSLTDCSERPDSPYTPLPTESHMKHPAYRYVEDDDSRPVSVCSHVSEPRLGSRCGLLTPETPDLVSPPLCHLVLFLGGWGERSVRSDSPISRSSSTPDLPRSPQTPDFTGPWYTKLMPRGMLCAPISRGETPPDVISDHVSSTSPIPLKRRPPAEAIATQTSVERMETPVDAAIDTQTSPPAVTPQASIATLATQTSLDQLSPVPSGLISYSSPVATPPRKRNIPLWMPALGVGSPDVISTKSLPSTCSVASSKSVTQPPEPPPRPSVIPRPLRRARPVAPPPPPLPPDDGQPPSSGWQWDKVPVRPADEAGWDGRMPWTPPEEDASPEPSPLRPAYRPLYQRESAPPTDLTDRPVWPPTRTNTPAQETSAPASPDAGDATTPAQASSAPGDINQKLDDIASLLRTLLLQNLLSGQGAAVSAQLTEQQVQALVQAAPQAETGDSRDQPNSQPPHG